MTTLYSQFNDLYDAPYVPDTLPEIHQIVTCNDWGKGIFSIHIPAYGYTVTATLHPTFADAQANTNGSAVSFVETTPTASGQIQIYYAHPTKTSWWEANSLDDAKYVRISAYTAKGSTYSAKVINEQNTQINTNTSAISNHESRIADLELAGSSGVTPTVTLTPANGATGQLVGVDVVVTFNKWLYDDTAPAGGLILYPTDADRATGTNAIAGTLTKTANGQLTFNPAVDLPNNSQYFGRLPAGLKFADGTELTTDVDWAFVVGSIGNLAPTATVQAITGTTTLGSTLTGHYTYADTESDPEGVSTFRWLRNGVAITGATAITHTIVEADLGTTVTFEVTPVASTGATTGTPVTSAGTVIPIPAPPAILVTNGNAQNTIAFTANTTFSAETYDLYWSTTEIVAANIKANGTKIAGITSPVTHSSLTNGTQYNYVLTMTVNGVESAPSAVVSGVPSNYVFEDSFTGTDGASVDWTKWNATSWAESGGGLNASSLTEIRSNQLNIKVGSTVDGKWTDRGVVSKNSIALGTSKTVEVTFNTTSTNNYQFQEIIISPTTLTTRSEDLSSFFKVQCNNGLYVIKKVSGSRTVPYQNTTGYSGVNKTFKFVIDATNIAVYDGTTLINTFAHGLTLTNFYVALCAGNAGTTLLTRLFDDLKVY